MLTTVRRSRPKGPLRAVPGATGNRKIGGRLCYCDRRGRYAVVRSESTGLVLTRTASQPGEFLHEAGGEQAVVTQQGQHT